VDFGLLDADGKLLANPVHYRDSRTDSVIEQVHSVIAPAEFYDRTGLQFLGFNTVYQLASLRGTAQLAAARTMLMIPDLIAYWLTGQIGTELTNASTTQLLDVNTGQWADDLIDRLALPRGIFAPLREAGSVIGTVRPELAAELGMPAAVRVIAVGTHDTASAVIATPAERDDFCYISSGTWSLVGLELAKPQLGEASRRANFSNEGGVDHTVRYLRNVMGLWLLQQSMATWQTADLATLLEEAAALPASSVFDCDLEVFLPPGDMPARIAAVCQASGQPVPRSHTQVVRVILDSLAAGYQRAISQAIELTGRSIGVIHIVGGGSQNALLCQLTADACGLDVIAGPVEASALGNIAVQARANEVIGAGLADIRSLIREHFPLTTYHPAS
jgi:rhamnulokinase